MLGKISLAKKAKNYAKKNIIVPKGNLKGLAKNAPMIYKDTKDAMIWTAKDAAKRKKAALLKKVTKRK